MQVKTIPQLNTEVTVSLQLLANQILTHQPQIKAWLNKQWQLTPPPIYGSVDLRNAGFKLAPIDMNLFPAGFNNLNPDFFTVSVAAARKVIQQISSIAHKILIIPEAHTRNLFYWANIKTLQTILQQAGYEIELGSFNPINSIHLEDGEALKISVIQKNNQQQLFLPSGFVPDLILLNNDLSDGIPVILQQVAQPIIPPAELGWSQRLKSGHFQYYQTVAKEFANLIDIDPWLIDPLFKHCGKIDFMQQEGMHCLIDQAEFLFAAIKQKYQQYKIPYEPFLVVKADAGTYGMAVMTVRNIDELKSMNRKQRTKMASSKGGQPVNKVIIQEGVYTFETVGELHSVAEPVVYLWGECVVGGFYRINQARGIDENLNAPGMKFQPIAFAKPCHQPDLLHFDTPQNRFYIYGLISQLSMLAAAREISDQQKGKETAV